MRNSENFMDKLHKDSMIFMSHIKLQLGCNQRKDIYIHKINLLS